MEDFFYLWLIFFVLTVITNVTEDSLSKLSDILSLFLLALGVIAMYGLAYERRIASRRIWRALFIFQAAFFVIALVLVALSIMQDGSNSLANVSETKSLGDILLSITFSILLYGPYFYGLYLYSFRGHTIWDKNT